MSSSFFLSDLLAGIDRLLEELAASEEVREALAKDTGERMELADVTREGGFDPSEFGL